MAMGITTKVILAISLATNALVLGAVAAGAWSGLRVVNTRTTDGPGQPLRPPQGRELTEQQRETLREARSTLREAFRDARPEREAVREARQALRTTLENPAATPAQIEADFRALRTRAAALQAKTDTAVIDIIQRASPEDRALIAAILINRGRAGAGGQGQGGDGALRERLRERMQQRLNETASSAETP